VDDSLWEKRRVRGLVTGSSCNKEAVLSDGVVMRLLKEFCI